MHIDKAAKEPIYLQLAKYFIQEIKKGNLKIGDRYPSVQHIKQAIGTSREPIFKAFELLQKQGWALAKERAGYFVHHGQDLKLRIMVVLDKYNYYKNTLFTQFEQALVHHNVAIDLFFHHHNPLVLTTLLEKNHKVYDYILIAPFFEQDIAETLKQIPQKKLLLIDFIPDNLKNRYAVIQQDFYNNLLQGLDTCQDSLLKYKSIEVVAHQGAFHLQAISKAVEEFGRRYELPVRVVRAAEVSVTAEVAYIFLDDDTLYRCLKACRAQSLQLGRDVGIISYNEHMAKELLGITTFSADFAQMGTMAAELIATDGVAKQPEANVPFYIQKRTSV